MTFGSESLEKSDKIDKTWFTANPYLYMEAFKTLSKFGFNPKYFSMSVFCLKRRFMISEYVLVKIHNETQCELWYLYHAHLPFVLRYLKRAVTLIVNKCWHSLLGHRRRCYDLGEKMNILWQLTYIWSFNYVCRWLPACIWNTQAHI